MSRTLERCRHRYKNECVSVSFEEVVLDLTIPGANPCPLAQQCAEYERLRPEAAQLASQLADALAQYDSSASNANEVSQRLSKTIRENGSLQE